MIRKLVLAMCLLGVGGSWAEASGRGGGGGSWLEKLSGPGPFYVINGDIALFCWQDRNTYKIFTDTWDRCSGLTAQPRHVWLNLGGSYGWTLDNYLTEDDERDTVRLVSIEPFFSVRVHEMLDLGVGVGVHGFLGKFSPVWRGSFQPLRIMWRPFSMLSDGWFRDRFVVTLTATRFFGGFDGEDFGVPESDFSDSGEILWAAGLGIRF